MKQAIPPRVCGRVEGAVTTVTVSGEVDWSHLPTFQDDLRHHLRRTPDVVIDLADLDSWSVTAQALFISAVTYARECGRAVAVIDLKDRPRLQLERSGLDSGLYRTLWAAHPGFGYRATPGRTAAHRRAAAHPAAPSLPSPSPTVV